MHVTFSDQYQIKCYVVEDGDTAQQIIDRCREAGAVRRVDGEEFCLDIRPDAGPELWTEDALRWTVQRPLQPRGVETLRQRATPTIHPPSG
jgi:hypothetical protein